MESEKSASKFSARKAHPISKAVAKQRNFAKAKEFLRMAKGLMKRMAEPTPLPVAPLDPEQRRKARNKRKALSELPPRAPSPVQKSDRKMQREMKVAKKRLEAKKNPNRKSSTDRQELRNSGILTRDINNTQQVLVNELKRINNRFVKRMKRAERSNRRHERAVRREMASNE